MTIYELLRKIVAAEQWRDDEREAGLKLVAQAERVNLFGTLARQLDPATHECRGGEFWPNSGSCLICRAALPVPPHECSPVHQFGNGRGGWKLACRICGKEIT